MPISKDVTVGEEEELISSCSWNKAPGTKKYRWNLIAPEGWAFLLQLNSTRMLVVARDIAPRRNQGESSSSLIYTTSGNYKFLVPDYFLSTTNGIRIRLSYPEYQDMYNDATFSAFVRTVKKFGKKLFSFIAELFKLYWI